MPGWTPEWSDVRFDAASAAAAADACRRAARRTDADRAALAAEARRVRASWEGLGEVTFDHEAGNAATVLADLSAQLRQLAQQIEAAAADATAEQRRREAERERWRREKAVADRARAEAAADGGATTSGVTR